MDFSSVKGAINPPGVGPSLFEFVRNPVGELGMGVRNMGLDRMFTNVVNPAYGGGQTAPGHSVVKGAPYTGLNKRDLSTSLNVIGVDHNPTVNALDGNGAYQHGVITLQDLINVQAATSTSQGG